jgi:hypothetical protein
VSSRLLVLTGPLFAIAFFVAVLFLEQDPPTESASGKAVVDYFNSHSGSTLVGAFGGPVLVALIVVFFSQLRALARERVAGAGAGPTVMISGAVLWAAGLLVGSWLELGVVIAADKHKEGVAETVNVLLAADWIPFIGGTAVTLIGADMTVLRAGLVARWLGWVALVVGIVALAGPGGCLGVFVGPLWMLVVGMLLLRAEPEPAAV